MNDLLNLNRSRHLFENKKRETILDDYRGNIGMIQLKFFHTYSTLRRIHSSFLFEKCEKFMNEMRNSKNIHTAYIYLFKISVN